MTTNNAKRADRNITISIMILPILYVKHKNQESDIRFVSQGEPRGLENDDDSVVAQGALNTYCQRTWNIYKYPPLYLPRPATNRSLSLGF